jgi:membrane protease YdiL (CAAX protease family)
MGASSNAVSLQDCFPQSPSRRRDLTELLVGYGLILIVIWTPRPWQRLLYAGAAIYLVVVLWRSFAGWAAMGLRPASFVRSLWVVGLALGIVAFAVAVALRLHTLQESNGIAGFVKRYWGYALWSFAQQLLLQDFFLARLMRLIGRRVPAALATAAIFALAHLPNPILTAMTVVWGFVACLLFFRYRNLYTLGMAHAVLGIAIAVTIPGPVTRNMRVGLGYLRYGQHRIPRSLR